MRTRDQAAVIDRAKVVDICKRNDISYLGVFGSYARGDFNAESDVDVLVRFTKGKSLLDLVRIERELAERVGRPIDLVTEDSVSPYLKDRIVAQVKGIYEREG